MGPKVFQNTKQQQLFVKNSALQKIYCFRILHMNGFTEVDITSYRYLIHGNVIHSLWQLIQAAKKFSLEFDAKVQVF